MSATSKTERITHTRQVPVSTSITAPAVRTVIVQVADIEGGPPEVEIFPVIAIESRVYDEYQKRIDVGGRIEEPSDHHEPRAWRMAGWHHQRRSKLVEVIAMEGYLAIREDLECSNTKEHTIVCSWPPEQDAEKLSPIIEKLQAEAAAQ